MDFIKAGFNQHELFINALICCGYDEQTIASKVRAYAHSLSGHERVAFEKTIEKFLLDAEFFNKQDVISILKQVSHYLS